MNRIFVGTLIVVLALCGVSAAESIGDVKARMAKRLPAIAEMKRAQAVGEDNQGYLAILKKGEADQAVVEAENKDRKRVYEAIAKRAGTDVKTVGRQRAKQIAERSDPEIMLQDEQGRWQAKTAGSPK